MGLGTKASGSLLTSDFVTKHTRSPALNHLKVFFMYFSHLLNFPCRFVAFYPACSFFQFTSYTYTIRLAFTLHPFSIRFASVSLVFPNHSRTIIDTSILSEPQKRSFILRVACPHLCTRFKGLLARAIHLYYLSYPHTYAYRNSYSGAKIRIIFYICKYI